MSKSHCSQRWFSRIIDWCDTPANLPCARMVMSGMQNFALIAILIAWVEIMLFTFIDPKIKAQANINHQTR
jgi:hypothetical protein